MKIASLGMYDRSETTEANQEFFSLISQELFRNKINGPQTLTVIKDQFSLWASRDLFFSQTCGLPYRMFLKDKVTLIGTPDYGIKGCKPGYYNSVFVVRKQDKKKSLVSFNKSKFAVNDYYSQSGWGAPQQYIKKLKLKFNQVVLSGSHHHSAKLVSEGKADITAIDAVSFKLIKEYDDFSNNLTVIDVTNPSPGLPFIAFKGANTQIFFKAIEKAIVALSPRSKKTLQIKKLIPIPKSEYLKIKPLHF